MSTTIGVPEPLAEKVRAFVEAQKLDCEVVVDGDGTLRVMQSEGRQQSEPPTLQAGGWIACPDAFALASSMSVSSQTVGKLLNELDIKVRQCQLGCF